MNKLYDFFKVKVYELVELQNRSLSDEEEEMLYFLHTFESSCRLMMEVYKEEKQPPKTVLIGKMELSVRAKNCLLRAGYRTLDDLVNSSIIDLMKIRNLGRKSLKDIIEVVREYGYEIAEYDYE